MCLLAPNTRLQLGRVGGGRGKSLSIFSHTHLLMIAFADNNDDDDNNGHDDDDDDDINNDNDDDEFLGAFLRHEKRCSCLRFINLVSGSPLVRKIEK